MTWRWCGASATASPSCISARSSSSPTTTPSFFDPGHPYTKALLSAVPTLEERRYEPRDCLLEGEPPSPIDIPPGCSFASRCPNAFGRCHNESPVLTARGDKDLAACFLVESALSHAAA